MTPEERQSMKEFEAKVRQVLAQFRVLKQENADLYAELEGRDGEIKRLKAELAQNKIDYNTLKLAKMIEISDADIMESKLKISRWVNVTIEGIQLPLQVSSPEEEKVYRDAASNIQRRIQRLRDAYPQLSNDKYYYVMAMLNTAVEAVKVSNRADTQPYIEMMHDIEKEIESFGIK